MLTIGTSVLLIALSFLTSALTASVGAGGGLLMLGVMASLLPAAAVIPVHGMVQLGSNAGRAAMSWRHIAVGVTLALLGGGLLGALIGSMLLIRLSLHWLELSIGLFILLVVWVPPKRIGGTSRPGIVFFGILSGFLGLFVGAVGPLISAYIQRLGLQRFETIATMAACMTGLNVLKLGVFTLTGFVWNGWLLLVALMIGSGLAGTWLGLRLLGHLPEQLFTRVLRWVLSALALNLCYRALPALLS